MLNTNSINRSFQRSVNQFGSKPKTKNKKVISNN